MLQYIAKPGQAVYFTFSRGVFSNLSNVRSSRLEVFCRKGVLKNFAKFTRKSLCQILFFSKVTGLRPVLFLLILHNVYMIIYDICIYITYRSYDAPPYANSPHPQQ